MGDEADAAVEWYSRSPNVGRRPYRPRRRAPKPLVTLSPRYVEGEEVEVQHSDGSWHATTASAPRGFEVHNGLGIYVLRRHYNHHGEHVRDVPSWVPLDRVRKSAKSDQELEAEEHFEAMDYD